MFYGRPIKTILDFVVKLFGNCSIAFRVDFFKKIPSWHTHRFFYHSKWIKNEEDMGFETIEGFEFFSKKFEIKYHSPFPYFLKFSSLFLCF